ncbi:MAG: hypothetical protein ACREQK_11695 [Candidatus Binatia bacterium]
MSPAAVPDKSEFPGTGEKGNGIPERLRHQAQWLDVIKTTGWELALALSEAKSKGSG